MALCTDLASADAQQEISEGVKGSVTMALCVFYKKIVLYWERMDYLALLSFCALFSEINPASKSCHCNSLRGRMCSAPYCCYGQPGLWTQTTLGQKYSGKNCTEHVQTLM